MAFNFYEKPNSRPFQDGTRPSQTYYYGASGTTDEQYVAAFARAYIPSAIVTVAGILYLTGIRTDPAGYSQWDIQASYEAGGRRNQTGNYTWSFDTTGATVRVTAAKEHIASYPTDAGNEDPHKGSIGVTKNGDVEGTEIVIPALKLQVQFRHPLGQITLPFVKKLARLTGTTNSMPWLDSNFSAGELLFLGAQGSDGSEAEAEITYNFAASENATGLSFGEISGIVKDGHHYAWVEFEDDVSDGGGPATVPSRVHIERVYGEANFASEFGWG